jgi:hypothetical protein
VCAHLLQPEHLILSSPGFVAENSSSQNMRGAFPSFCVSVSGMDFLDRFFDFAPHFPHNCFLEGTGRLFESKVGLLLSFNFLKYGLDVRIAMLPRVCPLLFNAASALGIGIMSLGLTCDRYDPF